jgi:hypothetical protein
MKTRRVMCLILMMCGGTLKAAESPHIGYAYPAGGPLGSSFEVTVGGQYLDGVTNVFISGEGVQLEVLSYAVRYEQRELRQLYRRKENLLATIKKREESGETYSKEQRQLEQIQHKLSLAELPDGITASNKQQALRSYRRETKEQFNPQIAERVRLRVSIDKNTEPGERELRVYTPSGLSNPFFFEAGTLAESREEEPNDDHMGPNLQTVPVPSIINGQVRPGDIDHFRFEANQGDAIVVNVAARRIIPYLADAVPGWFQAVVAIYDEDGNEVAYDDDYKLNPDPVLFFNVPDTGTYTLSIRDSIYRGREDFVYRIAIGQLPFITGIFPLGGQRGQEIDIMLNGWNLPQTRIGGTLPETGDSIQQLSVQKNGYRSNRMPFSIDNLPEGVEAEPNDSNETAQTATLPLIINARIQNPGDRDIYSFHGEKGDTVSIGIAARRLNSPIDSILSLDGPGIEAPVRNDDYMLKDAHLHLGAGLVTHHADSYLLQELPETGTYFVEVGDTQSKGGSDYAYRLRISDAQPDFKLIMEPSGLQIAPGGTAVFTVRAFRMEGFAGAVSIGTTNLPAGFTLSHTEIPADSDATRITITAPNEMASEVVSPEIIGTAMVDDVTITHTAIPVDDQMQAFLYRHLVPAQELVLASVSTPSPIPFEARLPRSGVIELPLGAEIRIPLKGFVHAERQGTKVSIDHPPEGIYVIKGWIGRKKGNGPDDPQASGSLTVKAEAPLKPGDRINIVPVAIVKKGREETSYPGPVIPIQIVKPRNN